MKLRKPLIVLAVLLVVYFIVTSPDTAAGTAQDAGSTLRELADNAVTFFRELVA